MAAEVSGSPETELLTWYARERRDLPWRHTTDPWAILVSEVMLQQTQVARVVPVYERFLARFPHPAELAGAGVADALRAWSGLGYNRRALTLRAAAGEIAAHGWPEDTPGEPSVLVAGLRALPGVGPYTAAAVASFAFGLDVAAVDTNVRRVLERRDGRTRGPAALARRAAELVPTGRGAEWNQALMELGATVCRPRAPRCASCPVRVGCAEAAAPVPPRARRARRPPRFEDSDRWARGRIVAALLAGEALPALEPARRVRVIAGLERDGLVEQVSGHVRLPAR